MEEYSVMTGNELSGQEKTWRNLKYVFLGKKSQSEKARFHMAPTRPYSGKNY